MLGARLLEEYGGGGLPHFMNNSGLARHPHESWDLWPDTPRIPAFAGRTFPDISASVIAIHS